MDGAKIDQRKLVVLGKLSQGKGEVRRPKSLFLSHCKNAPFIQLIQLVTLRAW